MSEQKNNAFSVSSSSSSQNTIIEVSDEEEPYVPEVKSEPLVTPKKEDLPQLIMGGAMSIEERVAKARFMAAKREAYFQQLRADRAQGDKYSFAILAVGLFATGFIGYKLFRYFFPAASAAVVAETIVENVQS